MSAAPSGSSAPTGQASPVPSEHASGSSAPSATARFRAAIEARDIETAIAQFAEDVTFLSPVVHRPYQGRDALAAILRAVFTVFEDFRYTAEFDGPDGHVLLFTATVDGRAIQGVDILAPDPADPDAPLPELTVMVRPYSAATVLRERMAALLTG